MATKTTKGNVLRRVTGSPPAAPVPPLVTVRVEQLFGKYSFPAFHVFGRDETSKNIGLLYGENGVGKTTIIRLIYALLADEPNSGLKGQLASTIFKSFEVVFDDGQVVGAYRERAEIGPYILTLRGPRDTASYTVVVHPTARVLMADNEGISEFLERTNKLVPFIVFINDLRTIRSSNLDWNIRYLLENQSSDAREHRSRLDADGRQNRPDAEYLAASGLERLLRQGQSQLLNRTLQMNAAANASTGNIYSSIAKRLFERKAKNQGASPSEISKLIDRIRSAQAYIKRFGDYTLLKGDQLGTLGRYLSESSGDTQSQLYDLVEPYVISIERQISQSRPIANQIHAFETAVNSFLKRKSFSFRVSQPFSISDSDEPDLPIGSLSSGERHLLYMLTLSMLSRNDQAIVLIDEPELSLNYQWQRRLVETMLGLSSDTSQFIMATHAFEIISNYRDSVIDLEPA
jgi:energy-coupling factor transporter ATP-binding protein EcfA2